MTAAENQQGQNENVGEVLIDKSATGKERPWRRCKMASDYIAIAYDEIDKRKAERLRGCASVLRYAIEKSGKKRLIEANFCRVRLCAMCQWRRALKTYSQVRAILQALDGKYNYIMLTLTMRNCAPSDLDSDVTQLMQGVSKLTRQAAFKRACKGWYRGVEITHNIAADTYHPHIHCLLAVNPSYSTSRDYIRQSEWGAMWQRALGTDYVPIVDVRRCKGTDAAIIAEVAKYAVKPSDILVMDDWDLTVASVRLLDKVLDGRRFVGMGGAFKAAHAALKLDDVDNGNLIQTAAAEECEDIQAEQVYIWRTGYTQYIRHE